MFNGNDKVAIAAAKILHEGNYIIAKKAVVNMVKRDRTPRILDATKFADTPAAKKMMKEFSMLSAEELEDFLFAVAVYFKHDADTLSSADYTDMSRLLHRTAERWQNRSTKF